MSSYNSRSLENLKPFSSANQAGAYRGGRKPSKLRRFIKENNVSSADVRLVIGNFLFTYSFNEITQILENDGEKRLPLFVYTLLQALTDDIKHNRTSTLELMMRYTIELPKQTTEATINPGNQFENLTPAETREALKQMIRELAQDRDFRAVMVEAIQQEEPEQAGEERN